MNKKDELNAVTPLPGHDKEALDRMLKNLAAVPKLPPEFGRIGGMAHPYLAGIQAMQERLGPAISALQRSEMMRNVTKLGEQVAHIAKVTQPHFAKLQALQNQLPTSLQKFDLIFKQTQGSTSMGKLGEQLAILNQKINTLVPDRGLIESLTSGAQKFAELGIALRRTYEKRFEHYPRLAENLDNLAKQGWFVSVDLPLSVYEELAFSLERLATDPDKAALVDALFVECFQPEIEELCRNLVEDNPHRAFAIQPAVAAHLRGEYALSVPVFFSQAEGIVRDRTERELFTKPPRKPEVHVSNWAEKKRIAVQQVEDLFDYFEDALWSPLCLDLPITWGPKERKDHEYIGLNRHTTLHGMDLDYASEVNSLKAFSLLCYVSSVFSSDPEMQAKEGEA